MEGPTTVALATHDPLSPDKVGGLTPDYYIFQLEKHSILPVWLTHTEDTWTINLSQMRRNGEITWFHSYQDMGEDNLNEGCSGEVERQGRQRLHFQRY